MHPSIYTILDTRRLKKRTGTYPVKLRAYFESQTVDYQTIFELKSQEEFEKLGKKNISAELRVIRDQLQQLEATAKEYAKTLDPFTFPEFELGFVQANDLLKERKLKDAPALKDNIEFDYGPYLKKFPMLQEQPAAPDSISVVYVACVKSLIREGRMGSAFNYQNSYYSLRKFRGNTSFKGITVNYLREFEHWHRSAGNSKAYVGILLRQLRAIFNMADRAKLIRKASCYPFGPGKYLIPSKKKIKEPLEQADIANFYFAAIEDEGINEAIDYWIFLYLGNGMNPKDMALLKYSNWQRDSIIFERAKTALTARGETMPVTVHMTEDLVRIIDRRGNKERSPDNYIFPFLNKDMNPLEMHLAIKRLAKFIKERMKRAFEILGINKKSSSQQARYACLNRLRDAGAPTPVTQVMAGHENPETTESYFTAVKDATKIAYARSLTAFKELPTGSGKIAQLRPTQVMGPAEVWARISDVDPKAIFSEIITRVGVDEALAAFRWAVAKTLNPMQAASTS